MLISSCLLQREAILNKKRMIRNQKGQILLLVVLIAIVLLTLIIAASQRATTDVRQIETSSQSNLAFSAAEGGIEDVLLDLKNGDTPDPCSEDTVPCALDFGVSSVKEVSISSEQSIELTNLSAENAVEVVLYDDSQLPVSDFDGTLEVTWDEGTALVLTIVLADDESPPNYYLERRAVSCGTFDTLNNFEVIHDGADGATDGSCTLEAFDIAALEATYPPDVHAVSMRVRTMYGSTDLAIVGTGDSLPSQATEIIAVGESGDAERTIKAIRTKSRLPNIFDFVLFSASEQQPVEDAGGVDWIQFNDGDVHSSYDDGGPGIDIHVENGESLCGSSVSCVFSAVSDIDTNDGEIGGLGWVVEDYTTVNFPIERYTYDAFYSRLQPDINESGTTFSSVSSTLSNGGIVNLTGISGEVVLDSSAAVLFDDAPVVVMVGNGSAGADVDLTIEDDFIGKNVVFIVSGDVDVVEPARRIEAAIIFDGQMSVI